MNANGAPPGSAARHLITAAALAEGLEASLSVAELLALSDERDQYERRILAAWRDGYRCGELAHEYDYDLGVHDGIIGFKRATKDIVEAAKLQIRRYGPGSRQFTDPSPLDVPWLFRDGAA